MKIPILLGTAAVFLGASGLRAAPPFIIVVPETSTQNYVLIDDYRPRPKVYDPYYYEVKGKNKKTIVKQNSAGIVTVKEKKKNKETITVKNRNGKVVYKETIKKKKK